ncbi:MAG TPA: hypothetical protein VGC21_17240, partial [Telluria sp.]
GLLPEPDDGWGGVVAPWLFGTLVHSQVAVQVRATGSTDGWGANDERNGTWKALRPDVYHVDAPNRLDEKAQLPFNGQLWELKPISWSSPLNPGKYAAGKAEVATYVASAKRGCWVPGSSKAMASSLAPVVIPMNGQMWNVVFSPDTVKDGSGLFFYSKERMQEKPKPATVPDPQLSKEEAAELKRTMDKLQQEGAREGWSTAAQIGMKILIGIAIALLIALAVVAAVIIVKAIIAALAAAIAVAATAGGLMAMMAAMFALAPATASAAETKAKEKEKGLLDSAIDWFKGWF